LIYNRMTEISDRHPIAFQIFAVLSVAFLASCAGPPAAKERVSTPPKVLEGDVSLERVDKRLLLQHAYFALEKAFERSFQPPEVVPEIDNYHTIFLTILTNNAIRCSYNGFVDPGHPERTKREIDEAVNNCIRDERFGEKLQESEVNNTKIVFNILYNKRAIEGWLDALKEKIELGIHAIEVESNGRRTFFKESISISKNYDLQKTLEHLCKEAKLGETCYDDPDTTFSIYDTIAFMGDREGNVTDLYRYNVLFDADTIDGKLLHERLRLAASWFANNVNEETGTMEYVYYPSRDKYSSKNNHVRQLATLWSIATLRNALGDTRLDRIIERTLQKYLSYVECEEDRCVVDIEGKAKIAYNAFLILALLETPAYPEAKPLMMKLGEALLKQQKEDGSYHTYFHSDKNTGIDYYPGEAMLALMRLFEETQDPKYLHSVEKAFPYYRDYWRGNKNTAFVPWHTQAYFLLYQHTEDPRLKSFVFEMNDWLIDKYQIKESERLDFIGGFPKGVPRNSSSSYLEGINDAYALAKQVGDIRHRKKYEDSIRSGIRFILLTQYTPENSFYLVNQDRTIGGFRKTLLSNSQRIDYTQHALLAILKALEYEVFD